MAKLLSLRRWHCCMIPVISLDQTVLLALRRSGWPSRKSYFSSISTFPKIWVYCTNSNDAERRREHKNQLLFSHLCNIGPASIYGTRRWQHDRRSVSDTSMHIMSSKSESPEKSKKLEVSEVKRLFQLAKPERWTLTSAIGLLALSSTITMAVPFALGHVIDIIYTDDAALLKQNLDSVCLVLSSVFLMGGVSNFGRVYLMNVAGQRITRALRSSVFAAIMKQEIAFFDINKTGELVNRLSADTSLVSQSLTMNISDGLRSLVMTVAGVSMMFYMSTDLAIVGLSIVPPVAMGAILYGRYVRKITKNVQDTLAQSTHVAEERIANIRTVRSFSHESKEIKTYDTSINHVLQMTYKESLARAIFFGMTGLSGNIIILSVLYYGGSLVTDSTLTVGQLSSFLLYAAYVGIALGGLSTFYSEMNRGIGASTRIFQLIERQPTIPVQGGIKLISDELQGNIEFRNVTFVYPTRPEIVLFKNLNLSVPSGSVVAVVGSSGSGKSTIGSLLLRLYDPLSGDVTIDGQPVTSLDPSWLRAHIGSVSQEPVLFSASIQENLLYGAADPASVTDSQITKALQEANALDFVRAFPDGLNTMVGERGIMLSGGQKQRIAIARALISNPKILLLDEATSALDAESESLVQEALERLMLGRTVITIAHRLSTIRNASQIAVLQEGSIVELGTYQELMMYPKGVFRKLVERQMITN